MNTKLMAKVSLTLVIIAATVCVGFMWTYANLLNKEHQIDIQKYESDFKKVKAGDMDILDEYSTISTLRTAIKSGFLSSDEIGTNNLEIAFLYELSKERVRTELVKRMKDHPVDSQSFNEYKWLLENLD